MDRMSTGSRYPQDGVWAKERVQADATGVISRHYILVWWFCSLLLFARAFFVFASSVLMVNAHSSFAGASLSSIFFIIVVHHQGETFASKRANSEKEGANSW